MVPKVNMRLAPTSDRFLFSPIIHTETPPSGAMLPVSKSVLLIEDYDDDESFFLRALRKANLTNPVLVLRTGEEALAYLQRIQSYTEATKHLVPSVLII